MENRANNSYIRRYNEYGGYRIRVIMGSNTSKRITEALLKLYKNNATKVLNLNEEEK